MSDSVKSAGSGRSSAVSNQTSRPASEGKVAAKATASRGVAPAADKKEASASNAVQDRVKLGKQEEAPRIDMGSLLNSLQDAHGLGAGQDNAAGEAAVAEARSHLGEMTQDVKAPNYVPTGGNTNNCANFASTMLTNQGLLDGREQRVAELERVIQEKGWRAISQEDALPGDLAFRNDTSHVELVSTEGGTHTIGSNNENPANPGVVVNGQQWITERSTEDKDLRYYTHRPAEEQ